MRDQGSRTDVMNVLKRVSVDSRGVEIIFPLQLLERVNDFVPGSGE